MPKRGRRDDPDAAKLEELARVEEAYSQLVNYLQGLQQTFDQALLSSREARSSAIARTRAALQAMQRHAQHVVELFGYVDGESVDHAHAGLLTAYYVDPSEVIGSRYCWALLLSGPSQARTLSRFIAALSEERGAFLADQDNGLPDGLESAGGELRELWLAEVKYEKRSQRLAYRSALLERFFLIATNAASRQSHETREVETELHEAADAAEEAARQLAKARGARIAAKRRQQSH